MARRTKRTTRASSGGTEREREMRALLDCAARSGVTLREVAEAAGVPPNTLRWWRREIARRDGGRRGAAARVGHPAFVEVVVTSGDEQATQPPAARDVVVEVELRGGRRLRVPLSYGIRRLVRELEAC